MAESRVALDGVRILDASGPDGNYCGKLLAELGAEVVLVEPPEGAPLRHRGPWLHGRPGVERSLAFSYLNTSKRSVVVDLGSEDGRETFLGLVRAADAVIDSTEGPLGLVSAGFGPQALREVNRRLIVTRITPYGEGGPYADRPASDITVQAEGGLMSIVGYDDLPLALPYEQAYLAASQFAAVGCMMALFAREITGEGQVVDVSVQQSILYALESAAQGYDLEGVIKRRRGTGDRQAGSGVFRCADGDVLVMAGGVGGNRFWPNLVAMMETLDPGSTAPIDGPQWMDRAFLETDHAKDVFRVCFEAFASRFTRAEIDELGSRFRVPVGPINAPSVAAQSAQLAYRGYFVPLDVDGVGVRMPGAPYQLSGSPWRSSHKAPRLGEHSVQPWGSDSSELGVVGVGGSRDGTA